MAERIDGRAVAARVREEVRRGVAELEEPPGLATVLVGDDPASALYVESKRRSCVEVGMRDLHTHVPADVTQEDLAELLSGLSADPAVTGILLQLPLPDHLDARPLLELIDGDKDVDGLTLASVARLARRLPGLRPCTPLGIVELLDTYEIPIEGASAVVVGRSELVGWPVAQLLLHRNATVTTCHSRTRDLVAECRRADILIAAVGVPRLVRAEHVKRGAVVIDVGIHRTDQGLVGDVEAESVEPVAGSLSPVPGGVGPMTIAMLLRNTLAAARLQESATAVP